MNFLTKTKLIRLVQKQALLFFALFLNLSICTGQSLGGSLKIDGGYSITQVKDTRHSSVFRTVKGWNFGLQYILQGERSSNSLGVKFLDTGGDWQRDFTTSVSASEMRIFYEHWRTLKNKNWQIGAYLDHGLFYTDRYAGPWPRSEDSPGFSYVMWSSLGLASQYHKTFGENWSLNVKGALPLLAFTERPPYSFTFPADHYDWYDDLWLFQPAYFKRAQFRSFTQFANLQIQAGLQHRIGQRGNAIGINYQGNYLFVAGAKPLFAFNQQFNIAYQFSFKKS